MNLNTKIVRHTKAILTVVAYVGLCFIAQAEVKPELHYNFGRVGGVTYVLAPQRLTPQVGSGTLQAAGRPVFYADAPGDKKMQGEGGILFNGQQDGYHMAQAIGQAKTNQVLEVWAKSRTLETSGKLSTVVAHGNGKHGYLIALRDNRWLFVSGGQCVIDIGPALKNVWTHLAMVIAEGEGSVWINGKRMATFVPTQTIAPNFSLACSESEVNFHGEIYEVRYSTFADKAFDPSKDFLLDYKEINHKKKMLKDQRRALFERLQRSGLGKESVATFTDPPQEKDWLIQSVEDPCLLQVQVPAGQESMMFRFSNGLVSRTFYVSENVACVGYKNLSNGAEYLRAVKPEARVRIDSVWYEVGGLKKQPEHAYLLETWYPKLEANPQAFVLTSVDTGLPLKRYPWHQKYNAVPTDWPAKGLRIEMTYKPTDQMPDVKDLVVKVNYEIYQGLPVIAKWVEIFNHGTRPVTLNEIETEVLAVNQDQRDRMHVESDFSFALVNADPQGSALVHYQGTPQPYHVGKSTTKWRVDGEYNTWASHNQAEDKFLNFPHRNLLVSTLPMGPDVVVDGERPFKSHITFELLQDSDDRERNTLGHRRMYKKLAPQVTESLLCGGISSHDEGKLKSFIDQMAELGFERLDIQAWPGIKHDNLDPSYVQLWRRVADYARERGIVMGGYELQIASRGRGQDVNCIHPETGKPGSLFGQSVCIASAWRDIYFQKMWRFFDQTGLMTYNMDGPYHGDPCASHVHPHHRGLNDSQWEQWKAQVEVLHELQRRNMYIPIPDWYFLNGQSATGMGYREASANLTPQQQLLLGRQYIYDGTWHKIPPMGWMTLQLVGFYTNDPRVGLEPLCENLDRYEQQLIQYLASGCQLTIRGNRLYDTPETKQMVKRWIDWFKRYRDILTSDIIHVSRPTGRDLDCILHVNPFVKHKGMVVIFNPTERDITKEMRLPLYYTGLKDHATLIDEGGTHKQIPLDPKGDAWFPVTVKAQETAWFLIEA